jgi:hypothetical protein
MADGRVKYSDGSIRGTANVSSVTNYNQQKGVSPTYASIPASFQPSQTYGSTAPAPSSNENNYSAPAPAPKTSYSDMVSRLNYSPTSFSSFTSPTKSYSSFFTQPFSLPSVQNDVDLSKYGGSLSLNAPNFSSVSGSDGQVLGMSTTNDSWLNKPSSVAPSSMLLGKPVASSINGGTIDAFGNKITGAATDTMNNAKADYQDLINNPSKWNPSPEQNIDDELYAIWGDYDKGIKTEEETLREQNELIKNAYLARYNTQKQQALDLIPQYTQFRDTSKTEAEDKLKEFKDLAGEKKTDTTNTYGDLIRKGTVNKNYTDAQRRNLFSQLGSAESSAFIENQSKADRDFLDVQNTNEGDMAKALGNIDKMILTEESNVNKYLTQLDTDYQNKVDAVNKSVNLSDAERDAQLQLLDSQFQQQVNDLYNDFNDKKASWVTMQQELANNMALLREQGNITNNTLQMQALLEGQSAGVANSIPDELKTELQGWIAAPYSGTQAENLKGRLKTAFSDPTWQQLVDDVFSGKQSPSVLQSYLQ